jgi:hypothetical protein
MSDARAEACQRHSHKANMQTFESINMEVGRIKNNIRTTEVILIGMIIKGAQNYGSTVWSKL